MKKGKEPKTTIRSLVWLYSGITIIIGVLAYFLIGEWLIIYIFGIILYMSAHYYFYPLFPIFKKYCNLGPISWTLLGIIGLVFYFRMLDSFVQIKICFACALFGFSISCYLMRLNFFKEKMASLIDKLLLILSD